MGVGRDTSYCGKGKASWPPRPSMGVENREDVKVMGSSGLGQGLGYFVVTGNAKTHNLGRNFSTKKCLILKNLNR